MSHPDEALRIALDHLDHVANEMERKWGVDRLRLLVDPEWTARFDRQRESMNDAIFNSHRDPVKAREQVEAMTRGWRKLDELATAAGAKPLDPTVFEARKADGTVVALVQAAAETFVVHRQGRAAEVWTLQEFANMLDAFPSLAASAPKQVFPGAKVLAPRACTPAKELNDEIPW